MRNSEIIEDKIAAYHSTHYCIQTKAGLITLKIGEYTSNLLTLFKSSSQQCGVVITAFNPYGKLIDHETNQATNKQLGEHLSSLSSMVLEAEGVDPLGIWPSEPSFFALGINRDVARSLGVHYLQDAVVWIGADAVPELVLLR